MISMVIVGRVMHLWPHVIVQSTIKQIIICAKINKTDPIKAIIVLNFLLLQPVFIMLQMKNIITTVIGQQLWIILKHV